MDENAVLRDFKAMDSESVSGARIALVCGGRLVSYRRDVKPTIPWPGLWDLPGGGREGAETPAECALREVHEEFGLVLTADRVHWRRAYPGALAAQRTSWFLAAQIAEEEVASIRFGDEGQYWQMMTFDEFLGHPEAIDHLQARFSDYLTDRPSR
jgi:8-oxo-dGTP diphosphatase